MGLISRVSSRTYRQYVNMETQLTEEDKIIRDSKNYGAPVLKSINLQDKVIQYINLCLNYAPESATLNTKPLEYFHILGNLHLFRNEYLKACSAYERIKDAKFKDHSNVLYGYATACFHLGNQPEAHKYYRFLLGIEPDHSKFDGICFHLGIIEKSHYGNLSQAIEFFQYAYKATAYNNVNKLEILYQIANSYSLMESE